MRNAIETYITNAILVNRGFTAKIMSSKVYYVQCVTKRKGDNGPCSFHLPVDAVLRVMPAIVRNVLYTRDDITIAHTIVLFNSKEYDLESFRNGLSGSALVIGIHNEDEDPYDVWELYTDTPSATPDRKDEVVTSEELRERAKQALGWNK